MNISNYFRIQKRMIVIHLAELFVFFEQPIKFVVNWIFLLTTPLWVGLAFALYVVNRAYLSRKHVENRVLRGEIWAWEMFRTH